MHDIFIQKEPTPQNLVLDSTGLEEMMNVWMVLFTSETWTDDHEKVQNWQNHMQKCIFLSRSVYTNPERPCFFLETLVALFIVSLGEYLEVAVGQMQFRILVPSFNFQTWRRSSKTDFGTPILNAMGWVSQLMWLKGLKLCYQHPDLWLISLESFSPET